MKRRPRTITVVAFAGFACCMAIGAIAVRSFHERRVLEDRIGWFDHIYSKVRFAYPASLPPLNNAGMTSWRARVACGFMLTIEHIDLSVSWNDASLSDLDDSDAIAYCLDARVLSKRREDRLTKVMAIDDPDGAWESIRRKGWKQVLQDASDTILLLEIRGKSVPWMAPGDLSLEEISKNWNKPEARCVGSSISSHNFAVCFVDGALWFLRNDTPHEHIAKFLTVKRASQYDRENELGKFVVKKFQIVGYR